MDYEALRELFKKRRSIRRFKQDPVPDDYIQKIIEAARWAPSGANTQPWEFIVVGDPRTKEGFPMMVNAIYPLGEAIFISSLANAFLYMHLAAASLRLGSQWLSATAGPYAQVMLKDMLGIPEELHIYETMVLGYPDEKPRPRMVRERDEMVHSERYDKIRFRTDAQIKNFISAINRAQFEAAGRS
jgi:nitroreductase